MNLHQLIEKLLHVESSIESMLAGHFNGIEIDAIPHVVAALPTQEMNSVHARLQTAAVDCMAVVIDAITSSFCDYKGTVVLGGHFVSSVSRRLQTASGTLSEAVGLWNGICDAYQELNLAAGGINKEEVLRYRDFVIRTKSKLDKHLTSARISLQDIDETISRAKPNGLPRLSLQCIRCPITNVICDKAISPKERSVFCGYQFTSKHYSLISLQTVISEALSPYELVPFFPDQQFEPVHISCQICHALQEAALCIFEISDSNPNVLFELGFAYMLGKTAILLAHKGSPGTRISDISGIHRIEYGDLVECRGLIAHALDKSKSIEGLLSNLGGTAP